MQKDLKRLLTGTAAEQDLLGLVTAAGGGLAARDLAELTGELRWQIDDRLATVTGRSFSTRDPYFEPEGPEVFLLGHEELHITAIDLIGPDRLAAYRDRLHEWASRYRSQHWPARTPEYLLGGYFRMLLATDDIPEMLACVTDPFRQDRLLEVTGGDAAALVDITTAMETLAAQDNPDLVALTRLAIHRDHLRDRNANMPIALAEAWLALGNLTRAESIANSLVEPDERAVALVRVAEKLLATGERDRAVALLDRAERVANSVTDYQLQSYSLASVAAAVATAGDFDRARALVLDIPWPDERDEGWKLMAVALAAAGQIDRAEALVYSIELPLYQAEALTAVAAALATTDDGRRLDAVVDQVRELVRLDVISDLETQVKVLVSLITALAQVGVTRHIRDLLRQAETSAERILDFDDLVEAGEYASSMRRLTKAWAASGDLAKAESLAGELTDPYERARALVAVARKLSPAGNVERATDLLERAEHNARSISTDGEQNDALGEVADGFARVGEVERAVTITRAISDPRHSAVEQATLATTLVDVGKSALAAEVLTLAERTARVSAGDAARAQAFAKVAQELAKTGDADRAAEAIRRAKDIARAIPDGLLRSQTMYSLIIAVALGGDLDDAERISASGPRSESPAEDLAAAGGRLSEAGELVRAAESFERAVRAAHSIDDRDAQSRALYRVVLTLAKVGNLDRAELVARSGPDDHMRSDLLATLATAAVDATYRDQAADLLERLERFMRSDVDFAARDEAKAALAGALALTGEFDRANDLVFDIEEEFDHNNALMTLGKAFALAGDLDRAEHAINTFPNPFLRGWMAADVAYATVLAGQVDRAVEISRAIVDYDKRVEALRRVARAVAEAGDPDRAELIARMITDQRIRGEALLAVIRARPAPAESRAVAEVLTLTNWHSAVPEVMATAPNALTEIFDELVAMGRS
jgi:tetratricopeptide (TPR) repeat protein